MYKKKVLPFSEINASDVEQSRTSLQPRARFHGHIRVFKQRDTLQTIDFFDMAYVTKKFPYVHLISSTSLMSQPAWPGLRKKTLEKQSVTERYGRVGSNLGRPA